MKMETATAANKSTLLELMRESHRRDRTALPDDWDVTEAAITTLLNDPQAGEALLLLDETRQPIGYMIMCRGFSLDYGGYFTWVEETYLRQVDQTRFRDRRYSP
jgi:hypothetical protein